MAKLNRVNIAITGDAKGLAAATDAATKELRRLNAAADQTKARLGGIRSTANQTAESLAKLGIKGPGLGAVGAIAGIGTLGAAGAGLAAGGVALAGASAAIFALRDAVQALPGERKAAVEALRQVDRDQRRNLTEFGFTRELATSIAAQGAQRQSAAESLGLRGGLARGFAGSTNRSAALPFILNELPGAAGIAAGTFAAGGGAALAGQRFRESVFEGRSPIEQLSLSSSLLGASQQITAAGNTVLNALNPITNSIQTAKILYDYWSR
jgi:hypothetical protein